MLLGVVIFAFSRSLKTLRLVPNCLQEHSGTKSSGAKPYIKSFSSVELVSSPSCLIGPHHHHPRT